jgi:Cu(I)/Ag(I) efflux system membrane fusion protein
MNKPTLFSLTLVGGLVLGGLTAYWFVKQQIQPMSQNAVVAGQIEEQAKPLFYRNPMNPDITSPMPAKDNMGMDYIPVYAENSMAVDMAPTGTVKIDPVTVQNMGVRTSIATTTALSHEIRAMGRVAYDEEHITRLHPKTEGWIEKLFIDKTGTTVKTGTMLLSIYSPQLVTSAQEYLLALKSLQTLENSPFEDISFGAKQMAKAARERLEFLDVPEHQIRDLEQTGDIKKNIHIHSPFNGVVINIGAREGQHVSPETELYMLADLTNVWVFADVFESDLPWVNVGDKVEMTLTGIPGKVFKGSLSYIYPYAEAKTRTIKVRLVFDNEDLLLKPDMFANVTINTQRQANAITIPSEAIVRSGERDQVFIVREQGKFEPRTVKVGLTAEGLTQIIEGVDVGDEVVTSSQFLIDSESKLRESTAKMLEALSMDKTQEKAKPEPAPANKPTTTFSIGTPEDSNNMRMAPSSNSTMDVKKHD